MTQHQRISIEVNHALLQVLIPGNSASENRAMLRFELGEPVIQYRMQHGLERVCDTTRMIVGTSKPAYVNGLGPILILMDAPAMLSGITSLLPIAPSSGRGMSPRTTVSATKLSSSRRALASTSTATCNRPAYFNNHTLTLEQHAPPFAVAYFDAFSAAFSCAWISAACCAAVSSLNIAAVNRVPSPPPVLLPAPS